MEVTKSVQDGIVGSTDGLSLNLSLGGKMMEQKSQIVVALIFLKGNMMY